MKSKLDIMSVVGLVLAIGLIILGIVLNQDRETGSFSIQFVNLSSFFDLPSIAIVVGGVFAALMLSFPMENFARMPKHLKIIFLPRDYSPQDYIDILFECAKKARMQGLLALEEDIAHVEDSFLKNSLQMIVDSIDPEKVKFQMETWIAGVEERHTQERGIYDKGAQLGPAFGMIGTLIGLINMLKNLEDVETVGPNMSVALITTFYGSLLANVLFAPISNKLAARHEEEYTCLNIVYEGVQAIQAGENPKLIQERLVNMLPEYSQKGLLDEDGGGKKGGGEN